MDTASESITIRARDGDYIDVCISHKAGDYETKIWFNERIQEWKRFIDACKTKGIAVLVSENMGTYEEQEMHYAKGVCHLYSHNVSIEYQAGQRFIDELEKVVS